MIGRIIRRDSLETVSKVIPILVFFSLWEITSGVFVPSSIFPPFSAIINEMWNLWVRPDSELPAYLLDTIFRGFMGLFVATLIGIPIGLAMARHERVQQNLEPVISLTYPTPKSPLIPLIIFWLGMGHLSRIILAVLGAFLPIVVSTFNGAKNVDVELLWAARSMNVGKFQETFKVVLPAALPTVITGVRIALIFSFVIVISSEMILARTGIGVLIIQFGELGQYIHVFASIFWAVGIVAGSDRVMILVSNYLLRWSEQEVGGI